MPRTRSNRCPREAMPRPSTIKSSGRIPKPRPRVSRPLEMASIAAVSLASSTGGHTGPSMMLLMRPMEGVVAAAAPKGDGPTRPGGPSRPGHDVADEADGGRGGGRGRQGDGVHQSRVRDAADRGQRREAGLLAQASPARDERGPRPAYLVRQPDTDLHGGVPPESKQQRPRPQRGESDRSNALNGQG